MDSNWKIEEVKQLGGHPAAIFLQRGLQDIVNDGMVPHRHATSGVNWDAPAVYMLDDANAEILGVVAFSKTDWRRDIVVGWAYVRQEFRRQGIHSALIRRIEEIAVRDGYSHVIRGVSSRNLSMIKAIEAQGYSQVCVDYSKRVISFEEQIRKPTTAKSEKE